jgi:hypothetical protein
MVVTMLLLGVAVSVIVPVIGRTNAHRRTSDRRELAIQTAGNLLERFSTRGWGEITQDAANEIALPSETAALLPEPSLAIIVVPSASEPPAKRITVAIDWTNRAGDRVPPARLTRYVFQRGAAP